MKTFTIFLLLFLAYPGYLAAQGWVQPCSEGDDELLITVVDQAWENVIVKVKDAYNENLIDTTALNTINAENDPLVDPLEPGRPGCHWGAITTGGTREGHVELENNTLYLVEIYEEIDDEEVLKADFLWMVCAVVGVPAAHPNDFFCGAVSGGWNDLFVTYTAGSGGQYEINLLGFFDEDPLVDATSGDDPFIYPHDVDYFCERIEETNKDCLNSSEIEIFVTDQVFSTHPTTGQPIFVHAADKDFKVSAGGTGEGAWTQEWDLDGSTTAGNIIVELQSGTTFRVQGDAIISNLNIVPESSSWNGIYIPSGGHLSINDGTTVEFSSYGITSYGEFDVNEGLPGADSVFFVPSSSSWHNIFLSGSGADGSTINRAVLENSLTGVIVGYADNVKVSNSRFQSPSVWGIAYENDYAGFVFNNKIKSSGGFGFYHTYGDTYLYDNVVTNSDDYSIYAQGSETVLLDPNYDAGENTLENSDIGVWANYGSVNMGFETEDQPPILHQGNNTVTNNSSFDVKAENGSTVVALGNIWDSNPPSSDIDVSSTFEWSDYSAKSGRQSEYEEAAIIAGDTSPGSNGRFVRYIKDVRSLGGRRSSTEFLKEIIRDEDHPQRWLAVVYYMGDLVHENESLDAVMKGEGYLTETNLPAEAKAEVARALFHVYTQSVKSPSGASRMRDLLAQYEHKDFEIGLIDDLLNDFSSSVGGSIAFGKRGTEIIAPDYSLQIDVNAYPNPFQYSTTIEFTLEEPTDITLKVYDVLGREVQRLVQASLSEGQYSFRFTPEDYLAQGLYFYRLESGQKMKVGKLIFLK